MLTAAALGIILLVLFWNRSLGAEIRRRNVALEELRSTQEQLVQAEKAASMGTLVSGLAHELNNPLNFVTTGVEALEKHLAEGNGQAEGPSSMTRELLENIRTGAFRATDIVLRLREYSRRTVSQERPVDVNVSIALALRLRRRCPGPRTIG